MSGKGLQPQHSELVVKDRFGPSVPGGPTHPSLPPSAAKACSEPG